MMNRKNLILTKCAEVVRKHGAESMALICDGLQVPIGLHISALIGDLNTLDNNVRFMVKGFDECDELVTFLR